MHTAISGLTRRLLAVLGVIVARMAPICYSIAA